MTAREIIQDMINNGYGKTVNRTPEEWIAILGDDVEMWASFRDNFFKTMGIKA